MEGAHYDRLSHCSLERELDIARLHFLAVVELYALFKVENNFGIAFILPCFGKGRDDFKIFILLDQRFIDVSGGADGDFVVDDVGVKADCVPFFANCDVGALDHIFRVDSALCGAAGK